MKDDKKNFNFNNLYRSNTNKVIAGICGGLGEYFEIDPIIFRIIFIILFIYGGSGFLIYFVLWVIIPKKKETIQDNIDEIKQKASDFVERIRGSDRKRRHGFFGIVLVILGTVFLLDNLGITIFDQVWRFWPILVILLGVSLLSRDK